MKTFSAIYGHPEGHGPQICAIEMIARHSEKVDVLFRNTAISEWKFPGNVRMMNDGNYMSQQQVFKKGSAIKFFIFLRFLFKMLSILLFKKYDLIVLFDPMAFYVFSLVHFVAPKKTIVWYHNYDVVDPANTRKYSLGYFAAKAPFRMFPKIDIFSLPMEDRVNLFPVQLLKKKYYIIPNYSLLEIHAAKARSIPGNNIKLLYVGSINGSHGLEQIIGLLKHRIRGKELELTVKGYIGDDYKMKLQQTAESFGLLDKLTILPAGPWHEVPEVIRDCHIGIAIYTGKDLMNATLGKGGSGKIYQYIAEGLPVLMTEDFYKNFSEYQWAIPVISLEQEVLLAAIDNTVKDYEKLSSSAVNSFTSELNCNSYFDEVFRNIITYQETNQQRA
jgi:glycosyltransferase involved in cell wall biosynthesis